MSMKLNLSVHMNMEEVHSEEVSVLKLQELTPWQNTFCFNCADACIRFQFMFDSASA